MKFALILAVLLSAPLAHAESIGWVDTAKLGAGSTEIARLNSHVAGETPEQAQQIRTDAAPVWSGHLRDACAKVKAEKHLTMIVQDPLAAEPKADVTADVLKLWNAADQVGVAQENARLTARVAQLEAAAAKRPSSTPVPPPLPPRPSPAPKTFPDKPKK